MFTVLESGFILTLLISCLIALLLVSVARREARAVREQANADAKELRDHLKDRAREIDARNLVLREAERELADERKVLRKSRQRTDSRERTLAQREKEISAEHEAARQLALSELEARAGLSQQEALAKLEAGLSHEARRRVAAISRTLEDKAHKSAELRAREILTSAMQQLAVPLSSSVPVTVIPLPSEEMRGRIIGKEGRNIRTFEALTGVDVVLEDGSDVVVLSCFDPDRRETATVAMATLLSDGRIHPTRIETAVAAATAGRSERAREAGRQAAEAAGVPDLEDVVVVALGQLGWRAAYGQGVLGHSVEVAQLAAQMAIDVGANPALAARAGLLHDIGKALNMTETGTHALVGARFLRRHGESDAVVDAVAAHHDEETHPSLESVLVQIADASSAARPGARREDADHYLQRMAKLEALAAAVHGVREVFVMAAGRDIRVVVEPADISDRQLSDVASDIAQRILEEGQPVGEVTVTVLRESRAVVTTRQKEDADDSDT